MAFKLVTPPAAEPVTLDQAKKQLRVDADMTDDDTLIQGLITAAREYCEGFQGRAYVVQTWELVLDAWPTNSMPATAYHDHRIPVSPNGRIDIPRPPLQSVASVIYTGQGGNKVTLDPNAYIVDTDSEPGRIVPATQWPSVELVKAGGIRIRFVAGYPVGTGTSPDPVANVPYSVQAAILLLITHWYENRVPVVTERGTPSEIPLTVESLLWMDRVVPI
jgi:uncharacterized phiE125 gp8 family phage protein